MAPAASCIAAGGSRGVFTSSNKGLSWIPANYGLTDEEVHCLTVCGTTLFAGTGTGVFLSTDNGTTWKPSNTGMPRYSTINTFIVSGTKIFAGTDTGIFLSQDNGGSWTNVSAGVSGSFGFLAANSTHVYALDGSNYFNNGIQSGNLYSRPLSEMSAAAAPQSPQSFSGLFKIARANGQGPASISFDLTAPSQVNVSVFSASGKKVATVFEGLRNAGIQNLSWSHAGLSPGLYFICMKTGKRVMVQKVRVS
jgi:hypothetical protein